MKRRHISYALSMAITVALQDFAFFVWGGWGMILITLPAIIAGAVIGCIVYPHKKNGSEDI